MRCTAFLAASLDGFIARQDGSLDWLPPATAEGGDPGDSGYDALIAAVDVLLMGRATYDTVLGFGMPWPYPVPVVVLTSRPLGTPPEGADVRVDSGPIAEVVGRLVAAGHRHAYVDGGEVVQQALAADLLDDLTVTMVPVVLGSGRPLYGDVPGDLWFTPDAPRLLHAGLVQTTWRRRR